MLLCLVCDLACFFLPSFFITHYMYIVIFAAGYERSLEESGKTGLEKGSWVAEVSPEKMCGRWMCSDCYLCFDTHCYSNILQCGE